MPCNNQLYLPISLVKKVDLLINKIAMNGAVVQTMAICASREIVRTPNSITFQSLMPTPYIEKPRDCEALLNKAFN